MSAARAGLASIAFAACAVAPSVSEPAAEPASPVATAPTPELVSATPASAPAGPVAERRADEVAEAIAAQEREFAVGDAEARARMATEARARAELEPTLISLLLAARLDVDDVRARETLRRAAAIAPASAWPQYALAHLDARMGSWSDAQRHLAKALELEPEHLPARRLEAALLARAGRGGRAIEALEAWLAGSRAKSWIEPGDRAAARLDLAQLYLLDGDQGRALEVLRAVEGEPIDELRLHTMRAAIEQARGKPQAALEAARAAELADPTSTLPLVQQALLHEHHLGDPAAARAAWQRVLEVAQRRNDIAALVAIVRARAALERAEGGPPAGKP